MPKGWPIDEENFPLVSQIVRQFGSTAVADLAGVSKGAVERAAAGQGITATSARLIVEACRSLNREVAHDEANSGEGS